jgi:serine/threonine-protein kinase HipA
MPSFSVARVRLWNKEVGAIIESDTGKITFQYTEGFRKTGLEVSPIQLPLRQGEPFTFPELQKKAAFHGLPGVFADALPDRFGNEIIKRHFEQLGRPSDSLSPVQKLLYVGNRAMGALTVHPSGDRGAGDQKPLRLRSLVDQARSVIEGDTEVAIPEIMQVGASAGGARAKALILWNRETGVVKSGFAKPQAGDEHWLIKFDGVSKNSSGIGMDADRNPQPWGRIEWAYARMAKDARIEMAETHLLEEDGLGHFMTKRFDRNTPTPPHMHTLAGLLHVDFNEQYQLSYEAYFDTIRRVGLGQRALEQAFRRMIFSVATINFDDHPKNFSFLMGPDGRWDISPAYDLAYAEGNWTRQHQMSMNGKFSDITRHDLRLMADLFDIPEHGEAIVGEVVDALGRWREYAREVDIPQYHVEYLEDRFERLTHLA